MVRQRFIPFFPDDNGLGAALRRRRHKAGIGRPCTSNGDHVVNQRGAQQLGLPAPAAIRWQYRRSSGACRGVWQGGVLGTGGAPGRDGELPARAKANAADAVSKREFSGARREGWTSLGLGHHAHVRGGVGILLHAVDAAADDIFSSSTMWLRFGAGCAGWC